MQKEKTFPFYLLHSTAIMHTKQLLLEKTTSPPKGHISSQCNRRRVWKQSLWLSPGLSAVSRAAVPLPSSSKNPPSPKPDSLEIHILGQMLALVGLQTPFQPYKSLILLLTEGWSDLKKRKSPKNGQIFKLTRCSQVHKAKEDGTTAQASDFPAQQGTVSLTLPSTASGILLVFGLVL